MSKQLNETAIVNELRGASGFFRRGTPPPAPEPMPKAATSRDTLTPRHHDTTVSSHHDTVIPHHDDDSDLIESVRRAVREPGKEAATHRFSLAEKRAVADIVYTYKQQGIRTSENEITRIAINTLIEDYRRNGENSLLAQMLAKLNE